MLSRICGTMWQADNPVVQNDPTQFGSENQGIAPIRLPTEKAVTSHGVDYFRAPTWVKATTSRPKSGRISVRGGSINDGFTSSAA